MNLRVRLNIYICAILLTLGCLVDCKAGEKVTSESYREYFRNLSFTEQKTVIGETMTALRATLPMIIDEYREVSGIIYMSALNTVQKVITFNVDYESIDQADIKEFSELNRVNSINSICTGNLYKTYMFEAGLTIRNNFRLRTGQNLFNYSIDKDDCLEAGYHYP